MVKKVVRKNWEGLTSSLETRITEFFDDLEKQFQQQGANLRKMAEHPSEGDEHRVEQLLEFEALVESLIDSESKTKGEAA